MSGARCASKGPVLVTFLWVVLVCFALLFPQIRASFRTWSEPGLTLEFEIEPGVNHFGSRGLCVFGLCSPLPVSPSPRGLPKEGLILRNFIGLGPRVV